MPPEKKCDIAIHQVKKLISSVLISNPARYIPVAEFDHDYRDLIGTTIPYTKLGFPSLKKFLLSIPDVLEMKSKNGVAVVVPVVHEKVAHINDMISKQKKSTSRKTRALSFIPPSVRSQKTVDQPHGERRSHFSSRWDDGPKHDLKSGASKKYTSDVNQAERKKLNCTQVTRKPEERRPVIKNNPTTVKEVVNKNPVVNNIEEGPGCSRDVKNCSTSYKNQPLHKQRYHLSSQSDNGPICDLKSVASKEATSDGNKLGNQVDKSKQDSTRVTRKPTETHSVNKKPLYKNLNDKPSCSREVQNCSTLKVTTKYPLTNNKAVIENGTKLPVSEKKTYTPKIRKGICIKQELTSDDSSSEEILANRAIQKGTKRLVSEKKDCAREIVKHSKIRTEDIAIGKDTTSDDSSSEEILANPAIQKGTKRLVSEKKDCAREIVKHSKIRTKDIAIRKEPTSDDSSSEEILANPAIRKGTKRLVSEKKDCAREIVKHSKKRTEDIAIRKEPTSDDSSSEEILANPAIQKGTKRLVSEKKDCAREIVKHSKIRTEDIAIRKEPTCDDSSSEVILTNPAIQKGTKRLVSEKKDCAREIVKHSKIRTEDIAIRKEPTCDDFSTRLLNKSDITTLKMLQGIKRRIETYEQYMARKGSSTEKEKAKSKERGRSIKKKSESGTSSSDSSRSSSESSSSSGSKSSSSSSSGSSSRSSSSSSDSSSSRNRNRVRTKQRSQSKPVSARKSVEKDKKEKIKEKENDLNKDKDKDTKSKTASVSDKKSDAKHRSRSRSRSSHRKKRHRSPTPRPTKIHIGRLTRTVNRDHIYEIFGVYGLIKNVEFPKDHVHSHIGRGYAYVEYSNADEAEDAMKHMDGGQIDGQEITAAPVLIPKPRPYMARRSPMPMRRPPMRRPPPHFRRRSPLRPPRRSPPRRRPRSRNSTSKRRKRSRSSSSSSR